MPRGQRKCAGERARLCAPLERLALIFLIKLNIKKKTLMSTVIFNSVGLSKEANKQLWEKYEFTFPCLTFTMRMQCHAKCMSPHWPFTITDEAFVLTTGLLFSCCIFPPPFFFFLSFETWTSCDMPQRRLEALLFWGFHTWGPWYFVCAGRDCDSLKGGWRGGGREREGLGWLTQKGAFAKHWPGSWKRERD